MMEWNENFLVGVKVIDIQHQELFSKINDLLKAMKEGKGKNEIAKTLNFLEEYTIKHFNEEEKIQLDNKYPRYSEQKQQHEEFKNKIASLKEIHSKDGLNSSLIIQIQKYMSQWGTTHITKLDKDLGKYMNI